VALAFSKSKLKGVTAATSLIERNAVPLNADRTADLRNAMVPCRTVVDYRSEIEKLWDHAKQSFLLIGRYLNDAKDSLPFGEFQQLLARELPFGQSQAFQFRAIAKMVDEGKVLDSELPSSASIAYELSKLEPIEIEDARKAGLLKGNVTRTQIRLWRREKQLDNLRDLSTVGKERQREALKRRITRLQSELSKAKEELRRFDP
jgi:hypothetical protein